MDNYNPNGCDACNSTGRVLNIRDVEVDCEKCDGTGRNGQLRATRSRTVFLPAKR